jgi:hypothetical protein
MSQLKIFHRHLRFFIRHFKLLLQPASLGK